MRTTPTERIEDFTTRGWWGDSTLDTFFRSAVLRAPGQLALIDPCNRSDFCDGTVQRLTFAELEIAVDSLAARFYEHGLRKDHIVVVQLPNIAELAVLYLALGRLGVILSPVPVQYGPFELQRIKEQLQPAAFITLATMKGAAIAETHGAVFKHDCTVFSLNAEPGDDLIAIELSPEPSQSKAEYTAYLDSTDVNANDIFTICWTSGTTGEPKGVPRSHNMWIAAAIAAHDAAELVDQEILLNPFPLVNMAAIGGFLYAWLMRAATLVLHQPFDLNIYLQQVQEENVSYTIAPPAVLTMLLKQTEILDAMDLSGLRCIGSGSAPLSEFMIAGFKDGYGIDILNVFGSNEGLCLTSSPAELPDPAERAQYFPRYGATGLNWSNRASTFTMTRLIDLQTGEEITEPGTQGELEIRGASVFDGYWNSPDANAEVFSDDGYFRTGDMFEIAGNGDVPPFYRFVGRCKDIIVRGGNNISPDEIDTVLTAHPDIAEVCVVGYEDELMGEKVGAVVVPKPGQNLTLEDVSDFLRQKGLAVFKLPEALVLVEALPKNATGKVVRRKAKALFDEITTQ